MALGTGTAGEAVVVIHVALRARLWEVRLHVIRIRGAVEIRQVAANARRVRAGQVVVVVDVTAGARHSRMEPGQREAGGRVIEGRVQPAGCAVALLTSL